MLRVVEAVYSVIGNLGAKYIIIEHVLCGDNRAR